MEGQLLCVNIPVILRPNCLGEGSLILSRMVYCPVMLAMVWTVFVRICCVVSVVYHGDVIVWLLRA